MPTLYVRDVPKVVYEKLKKRAMAERRSLGAETIAILREALERPLRPSKEILERIRERSRYDPRKFGAPNSTELLRKDRNR